MSHHSAIAHILETHPSAKEIEKLAPLLATLRECSAVCHACADACLAEDNVAHLRACIRTDADCSAICAVTACVASGLTESNFDILRAQLQACIVACGVCAKECEEHASKMEHCRICAETCRNCERACEQFLKN